MAIQKSEKVIKWFFYKIDFVARNRAEGKTFVGSIIAMRWYRLVVMFLLSLLLLNITFTTQKPGAYEMRWVAIALLVMILMSVFTKLFVRLKSIESKSQ